MLGIVELKVMVQGFSGRLILIVYTFICMVSLCANLPVYKKDQDFTATFNKSLSVV